MKTLYGYSLLVLCMLGMVSSAYAMYEVAPTAFVPPTDITLGNNTVAENLDPGETVGTLTTTDAEDTDPADFTYALVAGAGDDDNGQFTIDGSKLVTAATFDFETKSSYTVRIETTDSGTETFEKAFTITIDDVPNVAPDDITLDNTSVAENLDPGAEVGTFSTTDPEDDLPPGFTYALVPGDGDDDNGQFAISADKLVTAAIFDFETKNNYTVRIETTDSGGETFEKSFAITIDNIPENLAPTDISLDNTSVAENQPIETDIGTLSTVDAEDTDPADFTYALVAGAGDDDNGQYTIDGNKLVTAATFDFETKSSYAVRVETMDSDGGTFEKAFTITVTNVIEPPTEVALSASSVAENQPVGTLVGTLNTTDTEDTDQTAFSYALVAGTGSEDNGQFAITNDNELVTAAIFDAEAKNSYAIRVETTDSEGGKLEKEFTITVSDILENQAPTDITLGSNSIAENESSGTLVGTFSTTDAEDNQPTDFTYTKVAGAGDDDNNQFTISGRQLLTAATFDFETKASYTIRIETADSDGGTFEKEFTITVTNVIEPPTDIALSGNSIAENEAVGAVVGTMSTTDGEDTDPTAFTYALVTGDGDDNNGQFDIDDDKLITDATFDFETKNSYTVRIETTDSEGGKFEKAFTINVTDVDENQSPTDITLDNNSIAENAAEGSLVGKLSTIDPNDGDTFGYTLVTGAGDDDNASFSISGNQLRSEAVFDFETKDEYLIRVRTTDAGSETFDKAFTINITDIDEIDNLPPSDLALSSASIPENAPPDTEIGSFTVTDPDTEDTHVVTLVEGTGDTDNGRFQIRDNALYALVSFDFEKRTTYSIRVRAEDQKAATITKIMTITITDVEDNTNQAPTDIALSDTTVEEGQIVNLSVGTFSATDPNPGDLHTFSLVAGEGDEDNDIFTISEGKLLTAQTFDFETQSIYRIRVSADDGKGGTFEKALTITVNDDGISENSVPEVANPLVDLTAEVGEPFSFVLPENTFTDADADAALTVAFTLENDAPLPVWLTYNASNQTLSGTPPADAPDSLVVVATATDDQDASASDQFTLTIGRVTALNNHLPPDAWAVYPVPTDQYHITVRCPTVPGSSVSLRLLDVSGRMLRTYQGRTGGGLSEYPLALPTTLKAGTYFLEIETPEATGRKRILLR